MNRLFIGAAVAVLAAVGGASLIAQ